MFADIVQQHVSATYRATASNMQTKALASVIFWFQFIVVHSYHKHPNYLEREFHHAYYLGHDYFFMDITGVYIGFSPSFKQAKVCQMTYLPW